MRKKKAMEKLLHKRKTVGSAAYTEPDLKEAETYEQTLEEKEHIAARRRERRKKQSAYFRRFVSGTLIAFCLYLTFLIYGAVNTDFIYNDQGHIVPRAMTLQSIGALEDYNEFAVQYRQAQYLYEQVLLLDYRIAAGVEDPLEIAPEYETLLDPIESLAIQLGAAELSSAYTQALGMLTQWVKDDIAVYCQNMSRAISQGNEEYAANALEDKNRMYQNFSMLTQNLLVLAQGVEGADVKDIAGWSPEKFIEEAVGAYEGS